MPRPVPFGVSRVSRVRISISVTVQSSVSAVCWKSNKMPKVQLISHISLVLNVEWITRHNTLAFHNVHKLLHQVYMLCDMSVIDLTQNSSKISIWS